MPKNVLVRLNVISTTNHHILKQLNQLETKSPLKKRIFLVLLYVDYKIHAQGIRMQTVRKQQN